MEMFEHITRKDVIAIPTPYGYKCKALIYDGLGKRITEITYSEKIKKTAAINQFVIDINKLVDRLEARYNERRAMA